MPYIHPAALEHEFKRWMRPDAHRFIRSDWRRFVAPGSELWALYELIEYKYSPDQPRVPRGQSEGGQWTAEGTADSAESSLTTGDTGDGANDLTTSENSGDDANGSTTTEDSGDGADNSSTIELSAAGHHKVPKGVYEKYPLLPETRAVFDQATTGKLLDPTSNLFDREHRAYNDAVQEEFDQFLKTNRIDPAKMTPDQARGFLGEIFISEDPRIRDFNMRMQVREIRRFIFRRMRGFE